MVELLLRVTCICITLAGVETIHGIARIKLLVPKVGVQAAQKISIVTGSLLAFLVCLLLVPSTGIRDTMNLVLLGLFLAVFMASFDMVIGRYVAKRPWRLVLMDFNPSKGNFLLFGLAFLLVAPLLVNLIHR